MILLCKKKVYRQIRKSIESSKFDYFKRELKAVLKKQLDGENKEVEKSFSQRIDEILKGYDRAHLVPKQVRAVNEKTGKAYMKTVYINPNKQYGLKKYHEQNSKGAKIAIAKLIKAVDKCQNEEELYKLVLRNKGRFSDENGKPLPIVSELRKYIDGKNGNFTPIVKTKETKKETTNKNIGKFSDFTQELKENAITVLNNPTEKINYVDYTRENYNKLFPRGLCKTPIETVKLSPKQFERFEIKDNGERVKFLGALQQCLKRPDVIIGKTDNKGRYSKLYLKSFFDNNGKKSYLAVVPKIDGIDVVISNSPRDTKDIVKEIKKTGICYYIRPVQASSENIVDGSRMENSSTGLTSNNSRNEDVKTSSNQNLSRNNTDVKDRENEKRADELKSHIESKFNQYMNETSIRTYARTLIKKYGKKKLESIANTPLKGDEEYKKYLAERVATVEKQENKRIDNDSIDLLIWKQCNNVYMQKLASEKLKSMAENEDMIDLPVSDRDMNEAIGIIGSDVTRILNGEDFYGTTKQGLVDKIKRRVRNNPGVARAMFVYIKQKQKESGKKIFTEKNSIWEFLPQLNEQAKQDYEKGETETKTGVSGALYTGEDGTTVVENKDWGRYQISFPGKPDYETISTLKRNGFRWSPKTKTWVCFNTANGEYALERVAGKLGLKKTEINKSSLESYVEKSIRILKMTGAL